MTSSCKPAKVKSASVPSAFESASEREELVLRTQSKAVPLGDGLILTDPASLDYLGLKRSLRDLT